MECSCIVLSPSRDDGLLASRGIVWLRRNLKQHGVPEECIESILLEVTSLPALLEKHSIKDVTLLQVDTEGCDYRS